MGHIVGISGEFRTVHAQADFGRLPKRADDIRDFLSVLDSDHLDLTGLVFDIPFQVEFRGCTPIVPAIAESPSLGQAEAREFDTFLPVGFSVDEQFDTFTVGIASEAHDFAFMAGPVPVGKDVQHRFVGPDALEEIITVFLESAVVNIAGSESF